MSAKQELWKSENVHLKNELWKKENICLQYMNYKIWK